ncbi:hypothetical protein KEM48_005791 [Puccinia striiformis f. sp. tritici PST-130]|nr:hypothetical protein KEM48_005791 [Puccinia striiformis f. sp. tritici PST-130]
MEPSTSIAKGSEPPTPITNGSQPPTPMIESLPSPILITEALSSLAPITEIRPFPVPPTVQSLPVSQDKPRQVAHANGSGYQATAVSSSIPLNSPQMTLRQNYTSGLGNPAPTCFDLTVLRDPQVDAVPFTTGIAAASREPEISSKPMSHLSHMTHQETSLWDDSIPDNTAPLIGVIPAEGVHQFVKSLRSITKVFLCQTLPPQSTSDGKIFANSLKSVRLLATEGMGNASSIGQDN